MVLLPYSEIVRKEPKMVARAQHLQERNEKLKSTLDDSLVPAWSLWHVLSQKAPPFFFEREKKEEEEESREEKKTVSKGKMALLAGTEMDSHVKGLYLKM